MPHMGSWVGDTTPRRLIRWMLPAICLTMITAAPQPAWAGLQPNAVTRGFHHVIKDAQMRGLLPNDHEIFTGPRWGAGQILAEGHHIRPGQYYVIRIQTYEDPETAYVDEEQFEKLTLEIRHFHGSGVYPLPADDARGFYSHGSQIWGLGEYSEALTGTVTISASDPKVVGPTFPEWQVTLDLTAQLVNAHETSKRSTRQITGSYHCPMASVSDLGEQPTATP